MATEEKKDKKKPIPFILLDESVTTKGVRILIDGVDTSQFERNPIMFFLHEDYVLPIGRWENIRKEAGQLLADAVFDYEDTDPEVKRIIGKVERGFVKMASVDLRDLELSDNPIYKIEGQEMPTVIKSRLRESSIVPIGGCHNAFRLFDQEGIEIDLSDSLKLSDLVKPYKQEKKMNKELLIELKLSDDATPAQIEGAVKLLLADNKKLKGEKETLTESNTALQTKLDDIEKAEKEAKLSAYMDELALAAKDGRLDFDTEGKVEARWLKMYDASPEDAMISLSELPKRQSAFKDLSEGGAVKLSAMDKRRKEIQEQNKNK